MLREQSAAPTWLSSQGRHPGVSLQLGFEGQVGVVQSKSGEENKGIDPV